MAVTIGDVITRYVNTEHHIDKLILSFHLKKIKVAASCPWEILAMKVRSLAFAVVLATARLATAAELAVNKNGIANTFDGIGNH